MKRQCVLAASLSVSCMAACSEFETEYFKDRVGEASMERVAKRYGAPHKSEFIEGKGSRWTYFSRGSGTVGYTGVARKGSCHAYILSFDQQNVLREWSEEGCQD